MLIKNYKKLVLLVILAFTLSGTFLFTPLANAQVSVIPDTPVVGFDSTLATSTWKAEGLYNTHELTATPGKFSVTCDGSTFEADGVTLTNDQYAYSVYRTTLNLKPNTPYVMSGYVKVTNLAINPSHLANKNQSPFGFSVKYKDYNNTEVIKTARLLNSAGNATDGWKKLEFHFISRPQGYAVEDPVINLHLGNFAYDAKGKVEFAGVTLKEDSSYKTVSHSDFVAAVPVSQLAQYSVSDTQLDNWGLKLNSVTQKLKQLTGEDLGVTQCFMHNNKTLDADYNEPYAYAYFGGILPCHFSTACSEFTMQYGLSQDAVEHSQLHEISHTYNTDLNRVWNFDDEIFTNVRAAYAAIETNTNVVCAPYSKVYKGLEYKQHYDSAWAEYASNSTVNRNGYNQKAMGDIYLRMVYGDASAGLPALGWDVFKIFFSRGASYTPTNEIKLDPNLTYTDDFKVFMNGLDIIAQISHKSMSEIIKYIPDGYYYRWYYNPSQYRFKAYDPNDPNNI